MLVLDHELIAQAGAPLEQFPWELLGWWLQQGHLHNVTPPPVPGTG